MFKNAFIELKQKFISYHRVSDSPKTIGIKPKRVKLNPIGIYLRLIRIVLVTDLEVGEI